ncbi:Ubiquitin carboxyl-terminal hydrolase 5 [Escovopsis weberi]|uniref:Ubiquitin carboxyl-terminal hydrolase 5 n=1 Tax=Escovopsis weberi TaxID=150374 RepID=A0A0M8N4R5_ESCWE|nr:Ubiquitin carboxyl-terminal hydrolase 5 [Escovopsis weberi]
MPGAGELRSVDIHMAVNARHSMPAGGYDGPNASFTPPPAGNGSAPLPHIEDVVVFPNDIDPNQSMRQLLDLADATLSRSEMSRDYRKPALALKDYLRASVIAVQIIPNHYDYKELKSGRADWQIRHTNLLRRISRQDAIYDELKAKIIADNKLSGVKPALGGQASKANAWPASFTNPVQKGLTSPKQSADPRRDEASSRPPANSINGKSKPTVHPKPPALMSHAVQNGHTRAASAASAQSNADLTVRFANLRGPQSLPGQDPRIKTHQIVPPRPLGPREMPPSNRAKITLNSSAPAPIPAPIPALPKMPDAIYSPARANGSAEAARIPPSNSRGGTFSRTGSALSMSSPTGHSPQPSIDYFSSQTPRGQPLNGSRGVSEELLRIPQADTITPTELFEAMKSKGSILIIDVRAREHFENGHIMSSATICIEPSILMRDGITADDITESLVLSPSKEQMHFEKRSTYELVVLYNKDSTAISRSPRNPDETAVASIHRALVDLSYGHELRNPPKLLQGGIDAWADLMGPSSLQSTSTSLTRRSLQVGNAHPGVERRPSKYIGKPLKPDVVKVWQEAVETEEKEVETATEQAFHRSTESFLRRFPSLSIQESMVSPAATQERAPSYGSSHKVDLYTDLPSPPTRPAPAVPRPSYSGMSQVIDEEDSRFEETSTSPAAVQPRFYTGLNNPHNWCYANSTLQSLLASPDFGRELSSSRWLTRYKAPRKDDEKIEQPQLMIKIISNLFHWMTTGNFQVMKAQTLMEYSRHLCNHSGAPALFGGVHQQDAQEFMSFLMDHLHDETNCRRNRQGTVVQPDTKRQSLLQAAFTYWKSHLEFNQSIVDRYWRGLEMSTVECLKCHTRTYNFTPFEWIPAKVRRDRSMTLEQSMREHIAGNMVDDFSCDKCRDKTRAVQYLTLARMPPLLCVGLTRFAYDHSVGEVEKATTLVTWDFNDVDFTPFFIPPAPSDPTSGVLGDRAFAGPFRYECYAVIVHAGSRTDNGHYFSYVRDSSSHDPYAWFCCNDSQVTKVRIGSGDRDDVQDQVFKYGRDCVPYLAFFRRKS